MVFGPSQLSADCLQETEKNIKENEERVKKDG